MGCTTDWRGEWVSGIGQKGREHGGKMRRNMTE